MDYKGFEIIPIAGWFRVIAYGFVLGSANSVENAKLLINNYIYQED